jgi:hypothetical protein
MRRILVHSVAFYLALSLAHFLCSAPVSAAQNGQSNQPPGPGSGAAGQQMPPGNSPPSQQGPPGNPSPERVGSAAKTPPARINSPEKASSAMPVDPSISTNATPTSAAATGTAILKICVRTQDDSPFSGESIVHLVTPAGAEIAGKKSHAEEGETIYSEISAGPYSVEASAPGFSAVKQSVEIDPGQRTQTIFLIMKPDLAAVNANGVTPKPATASASPDRTPVAAAPARTTAPEYVGWAPPGVDSYKPEIAAGVSCSLPTVLAGIGERMHQFIANLQKFSATEHIEHYPINLTGKRLIPQTRNFDYVAQITTLSGGLFSLDEYRNGGFDRTRFPANVATEGLPAMALIFHPNLSSDFRFSCEGLGSWQSRPAWIVHFVQREDRTSRLGGYRTQDHFYPFDFKGRAWIDAGSYQVLRLQVELAKPIRPVGLTQELFIIDYAAVTFRSRKQQLWLPQSAQLYMERHGTRFYRIHTFSDFKIYTVDTDQSIHAPKEAYCFTNTSDHDIAGILTVTPASGISLNAVSIRFIVPPGKSVYKSVGPGKDVSMRVNDVGAATFAHNGSADAIKADAYLVKESTLDVIADTPIPMNP